MDVPFELRCLGEPALLGPDGQPVRLRVRKHIALLVYLVVESQARHRREHLAELLWPNLPEAEGRHSLATGLTALRTAFGAEVLDAGREGVRWAYGALGVDLDRLASGDVLGDESGKGLLQVAPFLEGFEIPGATEFQLWRERQRASWLPRVRDALVVLMDRCRRTGDSRQIERMADRMLALDDLSEEAVRAKMEARAFAGDRLSALRIFEAWKERLHEELGAAPSPLLDGMAIRLRKRGWERTTHPGIAAVRTEQWKDRPFIGRGPEYRVLYEGWERTQRNEPGHVLVVGESGIGKSTLVERLTTAAGLEGASVSRVQCFELEREIPFAAIGALVHGLLERPGATATSPEALGELSRAVPEVRRRYVNIPVPQPTEGETARFRIAEALHELVTCVADEHPLILVVDDHHFADDASLALLHILFRRVEGQQVMLVLVARQSEMGGSPHAVRLRDNLDRFGTRSAELPPLTEAESDELVTALVPPDGPQPNPAVRRALIRAGRGYPMVMELLCRDWLEHGERSLALSLDAMTADPSPSGAPIEAIRQLHGRILQSIDTPTRNILNLASMLGHYIGDPDMYTLADLTMGQTLAGMSRLTELRVLRDGSAGIEFINELMRAHVYLSVPSQLRRVLHGGIADRLIAAEQDGKEVAGLEVAWHLIRAGRASEGTPYLLRGSRESITRGAPHEAELALRSGLSSISSTTSRMEARVVLCEALQEQAQWQASLDVPFDEPGADAGLELNTIRRALDLAALCRLGRLSISDSSDDIRWLVETLAATADSQLASASARTLSMVAMSFRDEQLARQTLSLVVRLEPAELAGGADIGLTVAKIRLRYLLGERTSLLPDITSAITRCESLGIKSTAIADLLLGRGAVLCAVGNLEASVEALRSAVKLAQELGHTHIASSAAANLALCNARLGRYDQAVTWAEHSARIGGDDPTGYRRLLAEYCRATSHAMRSEKAEALASISRLRPESTRQCAPWVRQAHAFYLADCLWLVGRRTAAALSAQRGLAIGKGLALTEGNAGIHARWLAAVGSDLAAVENSVQRSVNASERMDAFDQAQCAMALVTVRNRRGDKIRHSDVVRLARCLSVLPPATSTYLNRFRLASPSKART